MKKQNKYAETEIYIIDFINKSLVYKAVVDNNKPNKKEVGFIHNAVEMITSIKEARELPKVS